MERKTKYVKNKYRNKSKIYNNSNIKQRKNKQTNNKLRGQALSQWQFSACKQTFHNSEQTVFASFANAISAEAAFFLLILKWLD